MFNTGMVLIFIGLIGGFLFSSFTVEKGRSLHRTHVDLKQALTKTGIYFGLMMGFGGLGLIGLALCILSFI